MKNKSFDKKDVSVVLVMISVVVILLVMYYYNLDNNSQDDFKVTNYNMIKHRCSSFEYSEKLFGLLFPIYKIKNNNMSMKDTLYTRYEGLTIIMFLSSSNNCNPCQKEEIYEMNNLKNKYPNIKIVGIVINDEDNEEIDLLRKIYQIDFPLYSLSPIRYKTLPVANKFPLVLLVKEQIIIYAYYPVPNDKEFIEKKHETIRGLLNIYKNNL